MSHQGIRQGSSRRGIILLSLLPSLVCGLLGIWQLERRVWKQSLQQDITERCAGGEIFALPAFEEWRGLDLAPLDLASWTWRRVRLQGRFDHGNAVQLWRAGAWHTITPLRLKRLKRLKRLEGRGFILIDRGAAKDEPVGVQSLEVVLWPSASRSFFDPDGRQQKKKFVRNVDEIAAFLGLRPVFGLVGDLSLACPQLRDQHLNYALTWFALMLAIPLMALFGRHAKTDAQ